MNDEDHPSKTLLRKYYRELRKGVKAAQRLEAAQAAARILASMPIFKASQHVACYLSLKDEFETHPMIELLWKQKKICYLPVLAERMDESKKKQTYLSFVPYQYGDPLHLNRYSILEPIKTTHALNPEKLDLVIMPLIAFDKDGHRVGTGAGYYDRTFDFEHGLLHDDPNRKPKFIGLGYASQETQTIPADPWDITLDYVLTENGFISVYNAK